MRGSLRLITGTAGRHTVLSIRRTALRPGADMVNGQVGSRPAVNATVPIPVKDGLTPHPLSITAAEDDKVVEIGTGGFHDGLLLG